MRQYATLSREDKNTTSLLLTTPHVKFSAYGYSDWFWPMARSLAIYPLYSTSILGFQLTLKHQVFVASVDSAFTLQLVPPTTHAGHTTLQRFIAFLFYKTRLKTTKF